MKSTKKSLVASGLALLVCCTLLIGTTFAWFTDSVVNKGNKIQAGTLNVSLAEWDGTAGGYVEVGKAPIFNYDLWEPGYTDIAAVKIGNEGTLALKYELDIIANGGNTDLAKVIDVYYYDNGVVTAQVPLPTDFAAVKADANYVKLGTLDQVLVTDGATASGYLDTGKADFAIIVLHMQESAGNEYQGKSIGTTFDIALKATQYTFEKDGFGSDQYDKDAEYPITSNSAFAGALAAGGNVVLASDVNLAADITKDVNIDLNGNTIAPTYSHKLSGGADLSMSNGNYVFENGVSYGHIDVRPGSTTDSVVSFEDMTFTSEKLNRTYGPCTDRVESVVEFTPEAGGKTTFIFKNCTFNNAQVVFEGMSGKDGSFTATFENCTFNNLGTSAGIYAQNSLEGTITVKDCTFNYTATASASAIGAQNATVTINFEGSNTVNGTAATAYTHNPANGEDETYDIKIMTPSVKVVSVGSNTTVNGLDTVTVTGIATK